MHEKSLVSAEFGRFVVLLGSVIGHADRVAGRPIGSS